TPISTWAPAITLSRAITGTFRAYAKVGLMIYRADQVAGNLFREGWTPTPIVGGGITATRSLVSGLHLVLDLGYDVHRFSTPSLRDAGFEGVRAVHHVGLTFGVSRVL